MSATLAEPPDHRTWRPAERLRRTMAAVRLNLSWWGVHKTLSTEQKAVAAESFGAEGQFLSAGKKLVDTSHPAFKAVTSVRNRIRSYWKGLSLPYPEPGIRLIRQDGIEAFDNQMIEFRAELSDAVRELDEHYSELKSAARQRLGSLYNAADYPHGLEGLFAVEWDFPSVEPPEYLRQLNPELYEQEKARVAARFDDAVRLAEEAFIAEMSGLVSHLTERITGANDGKPKVFRDSAITNLTEFFDRFRQLNVRSNDQLEQLVRDARQAVAGVAAQDLRSSENLRQHVAQELSQVQSALDGMLVDKPRRNILRRAR